MNEEQGNECGQPQIYMRAKQAGQKRVVVPVQLLTPPALKEPAAQSVKVLAEDK